MSWIWNTMSETLLSTLFGKVFERLTDPLLSGLFENKSFDQTLLDKLKTVLVKVDVVLSDAEEKQITNLKVRKWINELKDTIYHADDLLDEIIFIRKLEDEVKVNQVRKSPLPFWFPSSKPKLKDIKPKLKDIVEKLESLANLGSLNLMDSVRGKPPPLLPSTSVVNISEMFGREKDKAVLKDFLLGNNNSLENEIPVIAIVGIGGIGKTTLAQFVYNDPDVTKHFEARAWAHVTEECDVFKLTQIIFESVTSKSCIFTDLNTLQVKLKEALMKKRFLLVLDDIWKKFDIWDLLSGPLKDEGQSRSRVIVTTRNEHVASLMRPVFHRLSRLLHDDCRRLFAKHAFNTSNSDDPILAEIGEKIVMKSAGLPLAAKTLGCLLHSKVEAEEWDRILNSTIWDLPDNDESGCSGILPALYLSYYHLPSHLKQCFAYCSIFPKGHKFEKEKLILLWMAEGFLEHPNINNSMEEVGHEYFCELLSRSFFQSSSFEYSDESCFVMHDLVNDLAQFASGEFSCKFENGKHHGISKKARHFACLMDQFDDAKKFEFLSETEFLRTFLSLRISDSIKCSSVCKMVADEWLPRLKHLRVLSLSYPTLTDLDDKSLDKLIHLRYLDLSHTLIKKLPSSTCFLYNLQTLLLSGCIDLTELPEEIVILTKLRHLNVSETKLEGLHDKTFDKLIHLRYLDLSHTLIKKLPSSTCLLYNLQTLLLSGCINLTELPEEIVILTKLRHLNVNETKLEEMPPKFGNLRSLRLLTDFVVCNNSNSGSYISELGKFSYLRSTLSISKLENVVKAEDASKAELKCKKYLKELVFKWTTTTPTQHVNEVLNKLQPHENLKKLTIENYGGIAFPNWLGNANFSNMVVLRLNSCKYCTSLPPLGQLSSLQELLITKMEGLVRLEDNQFYGTGQTGFQPFPSLKTLKFTELPHWRLWIRSDHGGEDFPSLQKLQIQQCPEFIGSLPRHPSSKNWEISGCPSFVQEEELTPRVQPQASTDQEEESARRVRPRRC